MIKADVKDYEEQVIREADQVLRGNSLKIVELETVMGWIGKTLSDYGFNIRHHNPFTRQLSKTPVYKASNTLFVRDEDFVQHRLETASQLKILDRIV